MSHAGDTGQWRCCSNLNARSFANAVGFHCHHLAGRYGAAAAHSGDPARKLGRWARDVVAGVKLRQRDDGTGDVSTVANRKATNGRANQV